MHYIILFLAHIYMYTLDHMESESEVQVEQAQVRELTKLDFDQGKSRCI
jgi:hypothetical protein